MKQLSSLNKTKLFIFLISLFLTGRSSFSDDAAVMEKLELETQALNTYYRELQKLDKPTKAQQEEIQARVLAPAQKGLQDACIEDTKQKKVLADQAEKKMREAEMSKLQASLEKLSDDKEYQKKLKELNFFSAKGSSAVSIKADLKGGKPPVGGKQLPQPKEPVQAIVLDGSGIPKEIEFSGKKTLSQPEIAPNTTIEPTSDH